MKNIANYISISRAIMLIMLAITETFYIATEDGDKPRTIELKK